MPLLARIRQREESILHEYGGVSVFVCVCVCVCTCEYTCMYVMLHRGVVVYASVEFCLATEFLLMDKSNGCMKYCTANASIHPQY